MRRSVLYSCLVVCLFLVGAGDAPQSKPARMALDRYAAAKSKLDDEYASKLQFLSRQLVGELQAAMRSATKSGDLSEANAIKSVLDRMTGETSEFQIDATKEWQPTVTVRKGERISITAEGQWMAGPDKPCTADGGVMTGKGIEVGYLEGKIGATNFRVGSSWTGVAEADGALELRMAELPNWRHDNSGAINVSIFTLPPQ